MYKLFVNGVQIGTYRSVREVACSAVSFSVHSRGVKSCCWEKNSLFVSLAD